MSDSNKTNPEGEELTPEELETVAGALGSRPGGFGGTIGGTVLNSPSCDATTDTGMMGCTG